jgi:hypothetical protein
MSPVTNLIEPVSDGRGRLVIVLGAVDNTLGVSALGVSPWADAGWRRRGRRNTGAGNRDAVFMGCNSKVYPPRLTGARVAMGGGAARFVV